MNKALTTSILLMVVLFIPQLHGKIKIAFMEESIKGTYIQAVTDSLQSSSEVISPYFSNSNCPEHLYGNSPPEGADILIGQGSSLPWAGYNSERADWGKNEIYPENGILIPTEGHTASKTVYRDFHLWTEFKMVKGKAHSGVEFQNLEINIDERIDKINHPSALGGIYDYKSVDVLAFSGYDCWQTFEIIYKAAKFESGKKVKNAFVTIYFNGQLIHDNVEIISENLGKNAGIVPHHTEGKDEIDSDSPISFQRNEDGLLIRNTWVVPNADSIPTKIGKKVRVGSQKNKIKYFQLHPLFYNSAIGKDQLKINGTKLPKRR